MILKFFNLLWPFIKEMVLGKITFLEALVTDRKKVIFICLIFSSFGLNFITIERLFFISNKYIAIENDNKVLNAKLKILKPEVLVATGVALDFLNIEKNDTYRCDNYILPVFPPKPKFPLEEISKVQDGDLATIVEVEKKHILELHEYIDSSMKLLIRSHSTYTLDCIDKK